VQRQGHIEPSFDTPPALTQVPVAKRRAILREARFEDLEGVAHLKLRHGLTDSREEWSHFWIDNPALRKLKAWTIGWVLESEPSQEIVGYLGNIPLEYEFRGNPIVAAAARAWVVDAEFRSYSLLLLQKFFAQEHVQLCLATTANSNASPVFNALGGLRVPVGAWDDALYWITDHRSVAEAAIRKLRFAVTHCVRQPVSLCAQIGDAVRSAMLRRKVADVELESRDGFDSHFDQFWSERRRSSDRLLAVRNREWLEWHFKFANADGRVWILTFANNRRVTAYSVFLRKDIRSVPLTRMMLVDFQSLEGNDAVLLPMLQWALRRCAKERISMLEVVGMNQHRREKMLKLVPRVRRLPSWQYFYKALDPELARSLSGPQHWDPSMFDGDSSL
jgi:hypothetical protein